jgi:cytochrome P450
MTQASPALSWDSQTFVELSEYREIEEVLRRGRDFLLNGTKAESDEFVHGSLVAIDGREHLNRRRALMKMIGAAQPWGPEGTLLDEVFAHNLARVRAQAAGPDVRFDLIDFAKSVFWRVTAAFVGLDGIDDDETVARFQRLGSDVVGGLTVEYAPSQARDGILAVAREARRQIRADMFEPSIARRRALIAAAGDDQEAIASLPGDLLTSLLLLPEGEQLDEDMMFREMVALVSASINNPVSQVAWAVDDLHAWLAEHPEDRAHLGERHFLNRAVAETLRMHRSSRPHLVRIAARDVTLESSGRFIPAGTWVSSWVQRANHDQAVFGPDADAYNLNRQPLDAKVPHFGVAFGAGPHVCIGRPLLIWEQGSDSAQGMQAKMLRLLFAAGVAKDEAGEHVLDGPEGGRRFARYDVTAAS